MTCLKVDKLKKLYPGNKGIKELSFSLERGEILLLLGPNGAGKTTAIRSILGLTSSQCREVYYKQTHIANKPTDFMKSVGAMVSKPVFYEFMTGYDQLNMFAKFYNNVDPSRVLEVLDLVGLRDDKDIKISQYSTGMKQRLDFARAILHQPEILILDEPFNGMDIEQKVRLKEYLSYLSQEKNVGILISSHMLGDLSRLASRVIIIKEGAMLYEGEINKSMTEKTLEELYLNKIYEITH